MTGKRSQTSPDVGSPSSGDIMISLKEQDRFLPIANVSRIMKKSLPANAKISKEAKETVQECVSEYISFITGEASDKCQREKRKTINGDDLLWAMTILGFENYVGPLRNYLGKYRETEGDKTSMARQGDQSPTDSYTDHGTNYNDQIHRAMSSSTTTANSVVATADFQRFSGGFYSFGTQVNPDSYGESSGRSGTGYEDQNMVIGAFKGNEFCENGNGNGNRAVAQAHDHLHHDVVEW
ncbi:hypothetical protein F2P56_022134 [Juglans regia]|uniref:Nuclear transcription factor Y subunit B-8-like n=2 Tax=Juglans regia TaxID=51240 RepID=A0A2I4H1T6_JUGRE|nr:nuclear transcription factor Y subunit B-8-like [Juglans regia]KAF5458071.1 hypothetical protein F2P56_022134 [Juglans regia]